MSNGNSRIASSSSLSEPSLVDELKTALIPEIKSLIEQQLLSINAKEPEATNTPPGNTVGMSPNPPDPSADNTADGISLIIIKRAYYLP